jgi:hypothetical protein
MNRRAHKYEIMALYKRVAEIRKFPNAEGYRRLAVNNEEGATIIQRKWLNLLNKELTQISQYK